MRQNPIKKTNKQKTTKQRYNIKLQGKKSCFLERLIRSTDSSKTVEKKKKPQITNFRPTGE